MKVLFVPSGERNAHSSSNFFVQNLCDLANQAGCSVAICADPSFTFRHAKCYPMPRLRKPLLVLAQGCFTFEEDLYSQGLTEEKMLRKSVAAVVDAMESFQPDVCVSAGSIAAIIASRIQKIPCYTSVHSGMYRRKTFPRVCMSGVNTILYENGFEQVFNLQDLTQSTQKQFCFAPLEIEPYPPKVHVTHLGGMSIYPVMKTKGNRLCIFLEHCPLRPSSFKKILQDAFLGAPYDVYVFYPGCKPLKEQNMHYLAQPRYALLPGSIACINDGCESIFTQCATLGIPQLCIVDDHYLRHTNAAAARRLGFGRVLNEEKLSMKTLYESYRKLTADDLYDIRAEQIARKFLMAPDITKILSWMTK